MIFDIYQVDAFATEVFKGNPAAVVPLDHWLPDELMQQIAMENNLSETAFYVKTAGQEDSFHLRWFTPEYEIDLCGHATLATAFVIRHRGYPGTHITFTTQQAGSLQVYISDDRFTLDFPERMPQLTEIPEQLLASVGLTEAVEVRRSRDFFIVVDDEQKVLHLTPDYSLMSRIDTVGVIVTAKGTKADVVSRCFYPGAGIPEDPVTGSAHCNIVPYWAKQLGKNQLLCRQASPRGGELFCELKIDRVLMTGSCIMFMEGKIFLGR